MFTYVCLSSYEGIMRTTVRLDEGLLTLFKGRDFDRIDVFG